ncbi:MULTISPECIES: SDR family oxidoreductase [Streptomyces]|uniref:SDR family oxidoreductase n=1 Tax=Streptomyces mirabilis TaxID=68239 RepID=A0ABU3V1L3_9ACTN|nr:MULTISPECIES: SDR family oxidoreductase [Streptomyces]KAF5991630.1 short-chain dehydrogenase [Streptomyces sp. WAC00263]MCX4426897.1 SDR family oxidoreductase [Streptomyces mirabilis]MCX4614797.1 SDR family oxidoreductase [Streptomyces mirabilis]MCX5346532.1 SDR family oxidoreductase [Streptomyces mirabilis]MCZ0997044.1 SDR family oxidoreductase [Streptomyces mirabilis]
MRFQDKVAIVTGAGQGIGEGYARALAAEGARVVVAELNEEQGERVAKEIGDAALFVKVDVADPASAEAMAAAVMAEFGRIDYLVNNAAIFHSMRRDGLTTVPLDYLNRFLQVNLMGALHCTRAVVPHMPEGGAIVNQSSTAAWLGGGYYGLAKAGINSLTASLAAELGGKNIRVNGIAPGPTDTDATRSVVPDQFLEQMTNTLAIKRMGTPEDLAPAVLFLLSDEARWLTGQVVSVDGGQVVRL